MNIDQSFRLTQFVFNKNQQGNIKPDDFNVLAPIAQISVINQELGNEQEYAPGRPISRYGFLISQKNAEDLRTIITPPVDVTFTSGVGTYPADGLYLFNLVETATGKVIRPCEYDEAIILNESVIRPPISGRAIYYVLGSNMYVLPNTITAGKLSYVQMPPDPKWNYTITNGVAVYNPTGSQDFELNELLHLRIVCRILELIGVNLTLPQVTAFASALEQQGA